MDWEEISPEDAAKDHGVRCFHNRNRHSGELRFRLLSDRDETAYIRTVSKSAGAWRQSHYHSKVRETYIVQSGWIGYAEIRNGAPSYRVYKEGQIFTVRPEIVHNIYMPKDAVIHTIKHGKASGEQRLVSPRTKEFDAVTGRVSEQEILRLGASVADQREVEEETAGRGPYNEVYRHFDNLIWQVPAWTTAILAVVLAGVTQITTTSPLVGMLGLNATQLVATVSGLFAAFMFAVSHALFRFRWHQVRAKWYTPRHPLRSPQVFFQLLVNLQGASLLAVAGIAAGLTLIYVLGLVSGVAAVLSIVQERSLVREGKSDDKHESSES